MGNRFKGWIAERLGGDIDAQVGQALLEAVRNQAVRVPIPVTLLALVVVWLGSESVPAPALVAWLLAVAGLQGLRYIRLTALPRETARALGERLREAVVLSAINGVVVGLSAGFYPYMDEVGRCVHTMIMVGMVTGGVATSHGYRPLFLAFVAPVLASVIIAWLAVPAPSLNAWLPAGIAGLVLLLGLILDALARDSFRSFTDAFRINAELKRALRAEQSANNAKTRFLAAASHDLRQPLQTLSMFSAALARRPLDAQSAEIALNIRQAMNDLTTELDALLDVSKLDAGVVQVAPEPINVTQFVQRVVQGTRTLATEKGLDLRVELLASPWVETDRTLLERVLRNLVDNAIKYTEDGSVTITVALAEGGCDITVSDTGIGIAPHEQARVFEEFYQLGNAGRDRRKGLGLGLSIVYRLVPMLGGRISLQSTPGRGSAFTVTLPTVQAAQTPQAAQPLELPRRLDGVAVLLIEDDIGVRAGTRLLLQGLGCEVAEASTTSEALNALDQFAPDLVIADIRLAEGDSGLEASRLLRERVPGLPVVLVSGETSPQRLREADRLGAPLLVKPVEEAALVDAILTVLGDPES